MHTDLPRGTAIRVISPRSIREQLERERLERTRRLRARDEAMRKRLAAAVRAAKDQGSSQGLWSVLRGTPLYPAPDASSAEVPYNGYDRLHHAPLADASGSGAPSGAEGEPTGDRPSLHHDHALDDITEADYEYFDRHIHELDVEAERAAEAEEKRQNRRQEDKDLREAGRRYMHWMWFE